MTDVLTPKQRTFCMSRIQGKDTKPEMTVRKVLHALGYRYRLHVRSLPGNPDLVFPARRRLIFVNGCFWHGCPKCGRIPKSRVEFWVNKIESTKRRDGRVRRSLRSSGHKVLTVWEHAIRSSDWLRRVQHALAKG